MNLSDDDFKLFGLPPKFELDRAALDDCWRHLQARVHPDRFAADGASAQRLAMQWSVRVNEGYRRLRDPLTRGAYLCELRGAPIDAQSNTAMPAAFLMQQMQWREALEEAQDVPEVEALEQEVLAAERDLLTELHELLDLRDDPRTAAQRVRALMFVERFREDIEARLDALGQ